MVKSEIGKKNGLKEATATRGRNGENLKRMW
jgi:hypothetical protein